MERSSGRRLLRRYAPRNDSGARMTVPAHMTSVALHSQRTRGKVLPRHALVRPPSIVIVWPVMYDASDGAKEADHRGDLAGLAEAPQRDFPLIRLATLGDDRFRHARHDHAGRDGIHQDVGRELARQRAGQADDAALRRAVGGVAGTAAAECDGTGEHQARRPTRVGDGCGRPPPCRRRWSGWRRSRGPTRRGRPDRADRARTRRPGAPAHRPAWRAPAGRRRRQAWPGRSRR